MKKRRIRTKLLKQRREKCKQQAAITLNRLCERRIDFSGTGADLNMRSLVQLLRRY